MIDSGLKGRVVLITGGNNPEGIGAATARAFAMQGAAVFIHYFRQRQTPETPQTVEAREPGFQRYVSLQGRSADKTLEAIHIKGGRAAAWEGDLADPAIIPELFDRAERELGSVEVLVNNAAEYEADTFLPQRASKPDEALLWEGGPSLSTITPGTHDRHFSVNTRAAALMMAEFARRNLEHRGRAGRIINISGDGAVGAPGEISYWASKGALESYSRAAAAELGPHGITVNVVSPGPVQTGYITTELEKQLIPDIPLRRVGQPEDIADVVVFLASHQARWVTGQVIQVHGGHRMSLGR